MRPTAAGGAMTLDALQQSLLRGLHRDMAWATMHPVLGHTLEQITGSGYALNAFHRRLYEPFEAARRTNPSITFREFIATDVIAQGLLRKLLGDDQYLLATQPWGPAYFAARLRVMKSLRSESPPIAQWMSWGHWGPGEITVEVYDGMPRVLPVDFPVRRVAKDGTVSWGYPRWDHGRMRFYQNTAYAELLRRLPEDAEIPLDLTGAKLLEVLALQRDIVSRPFTGMSKLRLSTLQVVQMMITGRSPPLDAVLLAPGQAPPKGFRISKGTKGRNAEDARFELMSRLGDPELADEASFAAALEKQGDLARNAERPSIVETNPEHPVTQLSNAELVALARDEPGAPRIAVKVWELEHKRAQRSIKTLERVLYALDAAVDTSLIRHLCGLCDPHNLRLVTPEGHAAVDFHAGYLAPRYKGGRKSTSRWVPNGARVDGINAKRGPPDDTVDQVPDSPLEQAPDDLVPPTKFDTSYDEKVDIERGMNCFFGFSPFYLHPVAALLREPKILGALEAFERAEGVSVIASYNHLAGCINAAMSSYGMDQALMIRLFVDGRPL